MVSVQPGNSDGRSGDGSGIFIGDSSGGSAVRVDSRPGFRRFFYGGDDFQAVGKRRLDGERYRRCGRRELLPSAADAFRRRYGAGGCEAGGGDWLVAWAGSLPVCPAPFLYHGDAGSPGPVGCLPALADGDTLWPLYGPGSLAGLRLRKGDFSLWSCLWEI